MRTLLLGMTGMSLLLAACAPRVQTTVDPVNLPAATDFGPHQSPIEWWYVSSYLPAEGLAFHWAQFQVLTSQVPFPIMVSHLAITDLKTGKVNFIEQQPSLGGGSASFPPLKLSSGGGWTYAQRGSDPQSPFTLNAGPIQLNLTPLKSPVIHPPGYSGTPETGLLYYQGITRLSLQGKINGQDVKGLAWMDHQWGNQRAGQASLWDWMSIQMNGGEDLMLYRVKTPAGKVVQTIGSIVDAAGHARAAQNVVMEPGRVWTSASGRDYILSWHIKADEFDLNVEAVNDAQELLSQTTRIAYWEGPIKVSGTWRGQTQEGHGMMELVAGTLDSGK